VVSAANRIIVKQLKLRKRIGAIDAVRTAHRILRRYFCHENVMKNRYFVDI
jgi:hypothetical protein